MTLYNHTQNKANKLDLFVIPTLKFNHYVVAFGNGYNTFNKTVFQGSIYQVNKFLNKLLSS